MTDENLCRLAAEGDRAAEEMLVARYSRLVRVCARPLFLFGGDGEDLIQEGFLGLLSAIREFDAEKGAGLRTFAEVCIRNRLRSAVKNAARDRHFPLNFYVSLDEAWGDAQGSGVENPEHRVLSDEAFRERIHSFRSLLSTLEQKVLVAYLDGQSYADIARAVNRPAKSVDNAVQRIRRKVERQLIIGGFSVS